MGIFNYIASWFFGLRKFALKPLSSLSTLSLLKTDRFTNPINNSYTESALKYIATGRIIFFYIVDRVL